MAGKGGGAWKVAYADFVTAMMAFFMVMWITSQSDEVKTAVARHFSGPFKPIVATGLYEPLFSNGFEHPESDATLDTDGKPKNGASHVPPPSYPMPPTGWGTTKNDSTVSHVSGIGPGGAHRGEEKGDAHLAEVYLPGGSGDLDTHSQKALESAIFKMYGRSNAVEIRSYVPRMKKGISPQEQVQQWQESQERSFAIKRYLEERGISSVRIRLTQIVGDDPYGGDQGLADEPQAKNDRVEVVMQVDPVLDAPEGAHGKKSH